MFGHSRGGGAALNYALTGGDVSALVLDSTGYPGELANQVPRLHAPILILHGLRDSPADGGSAMTDAKMARPEPATEMLMQKLPRNGVMLAYEKQARVSAGPCSFTAHTRAAFADSRDVDLPTRHGREAGERKLVLAARKRC